MCLMFALSFFFFFNDTATTEIYTLSLHDALPISRARHYARGSTNQIIMEVLHQRFGHRLSMQADRKSTRLNSSHLVISYAVFCLKKKKSPISMSAIQARCGIKIAA